jgi:Bacterial dnaA protein helix-turn-helix
MDAVTILREIWRCRLAVGVAAVVAILVGLALTYSVSLHPKSRKYDVAIASSRILIDTPSSQVVTVEPRGLETLGARASVLANVMTEGEIKTIIAGAAGLHPNELHAGVESEGVLPADLSAAAANPGAHLLTAHTATDPDNAPLPIIEIEAQAPDSDGAVRLADAAVTGLQGFLVSKAANENVPDARRLRVTGLGSPQVRQEIRGPKRMVALAVAVFLFLCGCLGILALSTVAPGWRLSTLAPGWLPKLVPGRGRANAPSAVTTASVENALPANTITPSPTSHLDPRQVQEAVAARLDLSVDDLLSHSRRPSVTRGRQLAMYLTRELTGLSFAAIAEAFNRRHRTTVLNAIRRIETTALEDASISRTLEDLTRELRSGPADSNPDLIASEPTKRIEGEPVHTSTSKPTDDAGSSRMASLAKRVPGRGRPAAASKATDNGGSSEALWLPRLASGTGRADATSNNPTNDAGSSEALWRPRLVPGRARPEAVSKATEDAGSSGAVKPNRRPRPAPE